MFPDNNVIVHRNAERPGDVDDRLGVDVRVTASDRQRDGCAPTNSATDPIDHIDCRIHEG
jgi:hypothetical protein